MRCTGCGARLHRDDATGDLVDVIQSPTCRSGPRRGELHRTSR